MTIKDIIDELQDLGYNVSYYKRQDGGIRITRINGETYRGSTGNKRAREIVGASLSEGQTLALSKLKTPKGKGSYNKRRKATIDEETRNLIAKIQRQYRKAGKKEGKPTIRNYRYVLKNYGKKEADRLLRQAQKRIEGLAYTENVEALLMRMRRDEQWAQNKKIPHMFFSEAIKFIERQKNAFPDKWINPIYEILYDLEMAVMEFNEAGEKILAIVRS